MGKYDKSRVFKGGKAGVGSRIMAARVVDIILDLEHEHADVYGKHDAIGTISFVPLMSKQPIQEDFKFVAKPLFANIKNYPLINEIVTVITLTSKEYLDNRAGSGGLDPASIANNLANLARTTVGGSFRDSPAARQPTYAEKDLKNKPLAFKALDLGDTALNIIGNMMGFNAGAKDTAGIAISSGIDSKKNMQISMGTNSPLGDLGKGDAMTIQGWDEEKEKQLNGLA